MIVVLALLSIMLLYISANVRSLNILGRELKRVEQRQIKRLNARPASTAVTDQAPAPGTNTVALVSDGLSQTASQ